MGYGQKDKKHKEHVRASTKYMQQLKQEGKAKSFTSLAAHGAGAYLRFL